MAKCPDKLEQSLARELDGLGYELVLAEIINRTRGHVLRIYIDTPRGICIRDCETVSTRISALLDVEGAVAGEYTLEVSSPGIERPLVRASDFRRFTGKVATIKTAAYHLGRRNFTGVLLDATHTQRGDAVQGANAVRATDADVVAIAVEGEVYTLPLADIERAHLKASWPSPDRKGSYTRAQPAGERCGGGLD